MKIGDILTKDDRYFMLIHESTAHIIDGEMYHLFIVKELK